MLAVFATKGLLELGGYECDNLNFMNFKSDVFNLRIIGNLKIRKIRIINKHMGLVPFPR